MILKVSKIKDCLLNLNMFLYLLKLRSTLYIVIFEYLNSAITHGVRLQGKSSYRFLTFKILRIINTDFNSLLLCIDFIIMFIEFFLYCVQQLFS